MTCFRNDADYLTYLAHLRHLSRKYGCRVHAYCLMTNHVHMLLTPSTAEGCGYLMRDLGRVYVRYFNDRYGRTGTLWEGRFRACLVESASYVLACYRYIESNPVRAGIVKNAAEYRWSSHVVNCGHAADPMVHPHAELLALGGEDHRRHEAYTRFFGSSISSEVLEAIRIQTRGGYPLASDAFKSKLQSSTIFRLARGRPGPRKSDEEITTLTPNLDGL